MMFRMLYVALPIMAALIFAFPGASDGASDEANSGLVEQFDKLDALLTKIECQLATFDDVIFAQNLELRRLQESLADITDQEIRTARQELADRLAVALIDMQIEREDIALLQADLQELLVSLRDSLSISGEPQSTSSGDCGDGS